MISYYGRSRVYLSHSNQKTWSFEVFVTVRTQFEADGVDKTSGILINGIYRYILLLMLLIRVVDALESENIKYALVGGHAVALHGAVRGTIDLDFVIQLTKSAFLKTEKALGEIGLKSRLPVDAEDVFNFREEYIRNKNLIAWSFVNSDKPTEMVDIIITEDANQITTVNKEVMGRKIKVANLPSLITMKKKSGRPQDIEDVRALERL